MRLYVPSRDRWERGSTTLSQIPKTLLPRTLYVVPRAQLRAYTQAGFPAVACPKDRIAPTRQWILEYHRSKHGSDPKLVMLDDDLTFYRRATPKKIVQTDEWHRTEMFKILDSALDDYAHASIAMRLGANRFSDLSPVENTRMARVLALRSDVLERHPRKWFGAVAVQDDFHLILQLLRLGYPNCVITEYCQEQKSSNAPGGASTYRDMNFQAESVRELHSRWPDYVRIAEKKTKVAWNGQARLDVVCAWKKAFADGVAQYGVRKI